MHIARQVQRQFPLVDPLAVNHPSTAYARARRRFCAGQKDWANASALGRNPVQVFDNAFVSSHNPPTAFSAARQIFAGFQMFHAEPLPQAPKLIEWSQYG